MTDFKTRALDSLHAARHRTLHLTDCLDDGELTAQHSPLMSPLVRHLAHVGNFEEIHLVRRLAGRPAMRPDLDGLYDAFERPRAERPKLPPPAPDEARAYIDAVRAQTIDVIDSLDPDEDARRTIAYVAQHEHQHAETMLATHQLRAGEAVLTAPGTEPPPAGTAAEVLVEGGTFTMGDSDDDWALDNERPAHPVEVRAFWIDTSPVTCADFQRFIEDGGYEDQRWWDARGWEHRLESRLQAPLSWRKEGGLWTRRRFGRTEPVPGDQPVMHVGWYEADAYARWAGRRLPTEAEWEKAARWDPATGRTRRNPWGDGDADASRANLGQRHLEPAGAGSFPDGTAPCGAGQLIGDVWEWTASDFAPYPGFQAQPDTSYSAAFFDGKCKVLRGGSFGTAPDAVRGTFRNWQLPIRRQRFAGFRTARDAE